MRSRLAGRCEQTPSCTCTKITKIDNKGLKRKNIQRPPAYFRITTTPKLVTSSPPVPGRACFSPEPEGACTRPVPPSSQCKAELRQGTLAPALVQPRPTAQLPWPGHCAFLAPASWCLDPSPLPCPCPLPNCFKKRRRRTQGSLR